MSSPPKPVVTGAIPAVQIGSAPSGTAGLSSGKVGEKRRLQEDVVANHSMDAASGVGSSPGDRQRKIVRRDGDTDTASAKENGAGKTVPPSADQVAEEKEEGEISDEEMEEPAPSIPSAGKTSLLDRIGDPLNPVASNQSVPSTGSLSARMDPALMARIGTRGPTHGQSAGFQYPWHSARPPPRTTTKPVIQPEIKASSVVPPPPISVGLEKTNDADVTMKDVDQPRTKGVIGRSGNQTTVNGVAIPAPKGQGESQCMSTASVIQSGADLLFYIVDEAGQRELIEIIVELHNKGISTAQLTQRGVPAQLINRVMRALARPTPTTEGKSITSSTVSAQRGSRHGSRLDPTSAAFTPMQSDGGNEVDMDMDIDSENENSPNLASDVPQMCATSVMHALPSTCKCFWKHEATLADRISSLSHGLDASVFLSLNVVIISINVAIIFTASPAAGSCTTSATTTRAET